MEYKFLRITLIILKILITREIKQNTQKLILSFLELGAGALASHQQLPGSTRKSWTGLSSRQELDSGMHGSESRSGSQTEQGAGSSSEGGQEQRKGDLCDPPALN